MSNLTDATKRIGKKGSREDVIVVYPEPLNGFLVLVLPAVHLSPFGLEAARELKPMTYASQQRNPRDSHRRYTVNTWSG